MDFSTVYQRLENNLYEDPEAFVRDVRLIFSNSRAYNTMPRSRVCLGCNTLIRNQDEGGNNLIRISWAQMNKLVFISMPPTGRLRDLCRSVLRCFNQLQKHFRHSTLFWIKWPLHDLVLVIPPPPLVKVASNTRPCPKLGGTILNGGEGGGECYISHLRVTSSDLK